MKMWQVWFKSTGVNNLEQRYQVNENGPLRNAADVRCRKHLPNKLLVDGGDQLSLEQL